MQTISPAVQADTRRLREAVVQLGRRTSLRDPIFSTCQEAGLTPPQFHTLMWLGHDGPLSMSELAGRVRISEKTMTGLVDRLERAELVQRIRDQADRRVVRSRLTRKGAATYRRLDAALDQRLGEVMAVLDPEDREVLLRIFDKLLQRLALPTELPHGAPGAK
jgi:DNA-binding MarR family transcriptional regulator